MEERYWMMFYVLLFALFALPGLITLLCIFSKKFLEEKSGYILFISCICICVLFMCFCSYKFTVYCKDYNYVLNHTYIEDRATFIEFTYVKRDEDGNGQMMYAKPKFYLIDKDEYIILHPSKNDVEVGKTYLIRYYPNTKICEIVKKVV